MANKKSHKVSRKVKARKGSRTQMKKKKTYRRKHRGGAYDPMSLSLAQGKQFAEIHSTQHGGGAALVGAPVGDQGLLPDDLRVAARIAPLDARLGEISGMSDQPSIAPMKGGKRKSRKGGKKSKKSLKSRKASKKSRKASKKSRKASKKSRKAGKRKMRGGAYSPAPYNAPTMLLSSSEAAKAGTADFSNPLLKH
jgi:hypothetical protein